jgi:hypothetical protein
MKRDGAVRPLFNQLADFVTMALALIEQGQDQNLDAARFNSRSSRDVAICGVIIYTSAKHDASCAHHPMAA